jgi:hypothetical protein
MFLKGAENEAGVQSRQNRRCFLLPAVLLWLTAMQATTVYSQRPITQIYGFGHLELKQTTDGSAKTSFGIGEHDLFVATKFSDRISFLGEFVVRYSENSPTKYDTSIERSLVRFNYAGNHSIIAGKVHTPINYWNDVYHHGRLFFPTIDRPLAFSYIIPLHTLGIMAQGHNLGRFNFGYDLLAGNSMNSTDSKTQNSTPSVLAALHIKPKEGMRIMVSHYYDRMDDNVPGAHTGHNTASSFTGSSYRGPLQFRQNGISFAWFTNTVEVLNEFLYTSTRTDSLGLAHNYSNYLYLGYRLNDQHIPYVNIDYFQTAKNDLHIYQITEYRLTAGYRHEFSPFVNIKLQLEYTPDMGTKGHGNHSHNVDKHHHQKKKGDLFSFKLQLSYGF